MKRFLLIICCMPLLFSACNTKGNKFDARPTISVTIEPQRYFAEAIAGNRFRVVSIVPKGNNPESYDPTPQQLVTFSRSIAWLRIGYIGFEKAWTSRLKDNAPNMPVFDTSIGIKLITDTDHQHNGKAGIEPHIWNSTNNARILAQNTYLALRQISPKDSVYFKQRYTSLCHRVDSVESVIKNYLSPTQSTRTFIIYHPALSYFARDFGLTQLSIEHEGKEPSPAELKSLIDRCKKEQIRVIFIQPEFDKQHATLIAKETGAHIVSINPLNYRWDEEMLSIARNLAANK